jgi:hypothetical protein
MITLTNTTHILEVTTGSATAVDVFVSYADHTTSGAVLGDQQTLITTATTTTVLAAPAGSTQRQIKLISINNTGATPNTVTVQKDISGTEYDLFYTTLQANENLTYVDGRGWTQYTATGQAYTANVTSNAPFANTKLLTGALYETFDRDLCNEVNTAVLSSGRLSLQAIYIPAGVTITSISFWSATTAANGPTNQLFGLYDVNLNLLRSSVNDTSTAWAANSRKTLALTSTFTTTYSGLYYLGIMVTASTAVPTLKGNTAKTNGALNAGAPSMGGTSNTGLTTALPATANAPGLVTTSFWGCVN